MLIYGESDLSGPGLRPSVAVNTPSLLDVNGDSIADLLIGDPNVAGAPEEPTLFWRHYWRKAWT